VFLISVTVMLKMVAPDVIVHDIPVHALGVLFMKSQLW